MAISADILALIVGFVGGAAGFAAALWAIFNYFTKQITIPLSEVQSKLVAADIDIKNLTAAFKSIQFIPIGKDSSEIQKVIQDIREQVSEVYERTSKGFEIDPTPRIEFDSNGFCLCVNESFSGLTGLSKTECEGNGWLRAIHDNEQEKIRKRINSSFSVGLNLQFDSVRMFDSKKKEFTAQLRLAQIACKSETQYIGVLMPLR